MFTAAAAFAGGPPSIEKLLEQGKADFTIARDTLSLEQSKIQVDGIKQKTRKKQWFYKSQKKIDDYINKNAVVTDGGRAGDIYASIFRQSDLILLGEAHEPDDGLKLKMLELIREYNQKADAFHYKKITDIFYENPSSVQAVLDGTKRVAALLPEAEKEAYCDAETKKHFAGHPLDKQPAMAMMCVLNASGVNVVFPDFNRYTDCSPETARYCEDHKQCLLCPTAHISAMDDLGVNLRNALIFSKMKAAVDAGGKAVFMGGAAHVGYGDINQTDSLSDMSVADLKGKIVYSILSFKRFAAVKPVPEKKDCPLCKAESHIFLVSFLPKLGNQFSKDKFKFVLFVPGNGEDAAYRSRPADMLVFWPS